MNKEVMFSSEKDNWETPDDLFEEWDVIYDFTVDVASDEFNHKVDKYYTKETDGLSQNWDNEIVWCNPPYGRAILDWVRKAATSKCVSVLLLPARTDTRWFHDYIYTNPNARIFFLKGRLRFKGAPSSAPFPSMIVVIDNMNALVM